MAKKIYFTYNENGELLDRDGTAEFLFQKKGIFVTEDMHRVKLFFSLNETEVQAWDYNTEEDRIILKNGYEVGIADEVFDLTGDFVSEEELIERFKKKETFNLKNILSFSKSNSSITKEFKQENQDSKEDEAENDDLLIYDQLVGSINSLINDFNKKQAISAQEIQKLKTSLRKMKNDKTKLKNQLETTYFELIDLQNILNTKVSNIEKSKAIGIIAHKIMPLQKEDEEVNRQ